MIRITLLILLTLLASACSMFGTKDNTDPPAELVRLESNIKLDRLWHTDIGKGTDGRYLILQPAIDAGRIFATEYRGRVAAYDVETGKQIWKTDTGSRITGGVGVGGNLVLVGTSEADIVALDQGDGHEVWRTLLNSQVLSQPAANLDTVVAHALGGDLYGLDASSGERKWIFDRNVPVLSLRGSSSPVLVQDIVISGFANGNLIALEANVGRQIWEAAVATPHGRSELERMVDIDSAPQLWGTAVYAVAFNGRVVAIDGNSGNIIWNRDMSSSAGLSVDYRSVYVTDQSSNVWALDRETGGSMWRQDKLLNRNLTAPVPIDDYVAAGDFEGYLHILNASSGELVARERVDSDGLLARPLVKDNVMYVYGNGGTLAAYRVAVP